jgi:dTDP-4-dehydrorhamnose 3,5-epimerase
VPRPGRDEDEEEEADMLQLQERPARREAKNVLAAETGALEVRAARLDGVKLLRPTTLFEDFRGEYVEIYNRALATAAGIEIDFVQDDISVSTHNVLRGIHGDDATWKLISCLYGRFYLVVVNYDQSSSQYRQWEAFTLSDKNRLQVLVPPRFGNGHLVLSEQAIFHYKQSSYYDRARQFTLAWDDPALALWWPRREPIVSQRDQGVTRRALDGSGASS